MPSSWLTRWAMRAMSPDRERRSSPVSGSSQVRRGTGRRDDERILGDRLGECLVARVKRERRRDHRPKLLDDMTRKRDDLGVLGHHAPVPPEAVAGLLVAHEKPDVLENVERRLVYFRRERIRQELGEPRDHGTVLRSKDHPVIIAGARAVPEYRPQRRDRTGVLDGLLSGDATNPSGAVQFNHGPERGTRFGCCSDTRSSNVPSGIWGSKLTMRWRSPSRPTCNPAMLLPCHNPSRLRERAGRGLG